MLIVVVHQDYIYAGNVEPSVDDVGIRWADGEP